MNATDAVVVLEQEIAATQKSIRRFDEAGDIYHSDLASARCWAFLFARALLTAAPLPCAHPTHKVTGHDERGNALWACAGCDDPYPHVATKVAS